MSIKVDMTSADVDKQLQLLEYYPEILVKYFRPALKMGVKELDSSIRPNIPVDKGKALAAFKSRVTGSGLKLQGQVGWWGKTPAWYINIVEHGSRRHPINAGTSSRSKSKRARFEAGDSKFGSDDRGGTHINVGGRWVTKTVVNGMSARGFMAAGFAAVQPMIDTQMAQASENVLTELAVP